MIRVALIGIAVGNICIILALVGLTIVVKELIKVVNNFIETLYRKEIK